MNTKKICKIIDKYKVVSFDVFDTLLVRMTRNPSEVFRIMENEFSKVYEPKNIYFDRIAAEKKARELSAKNEISLDDIYDCFINYFLEEITWLKRMEVELEKKLLRMNPIVEPVYHYCLNKGKKIVIQSDMYLSKSVIEEFLASNGIVYDYLAVSSEINATKRSGSMYDDTLSKRKIMPKDMVHLGDSIKSDFVMARKKGIRSILVKKYYNPSDSLLTAQEFDSLIHLKVKKLDDPYQKIGFEVMGPFYLGYSCWLKNKFEELGINKVFFLSRDGYIMQKAYRLLDDDGVEDRYLYVSRNSLIIPALYYFSDYEEVLELTNISVLEYIDVELFLNKIGLSSADCADELIALGIEPKTTIKGSELSGDQNVEKLFYSVRQKMLRNSEKQLEELLIYLKSHNFCEKLAIVDIGWQGTMQKALRLILEKAGIPADIYGFYVGLKKNAIDYNSGKMYGYCFDPQNNDLENKLFSFGGLFEYFYSNQEGSVQGYKNGAPLLAENEYSGTKYCDVMEKIQKGGLMYLENILKYYRYYHPSDYRNYSIRKLISFGVNPSLKNLKRFHTLYYSNINNYYLLPQHTVFYYAFHLKELKRDLNQSFWKVGFLKSLLKIPLPYFRVYNYLKGK